MHDPAHGSATSASALVAWAAVAAVLALALLGAFSVDTSAPGASLGLRLFAACGLASVTGLAVFWRATLRHPAPPAAQKNQSVATWQWTALVAILALASLLRAIGLNAPLWYDEVVTLVEFVRLPVPELLTKYTTTNNHLLYSLAANRSVALFGENAAAIRLPALLFGVGSIAALWQLGCEIASRREALLACLLLALSYHHVWFSQNARGYTGILFFTLLSTHLFVLGMRRSSRETWLGYAAIVAFGLYTHLSIAFVFTTHGLLYLALLARARVTGSSAGHPGAAEWWPAGGFGLGVLLALLLYAIPLPQVVEAFSAQQAGSSGKRVEDWTHPLWMLLELARGLGLGGIALLGGAAVATVAGLGFASLARRDWLVGAVLALPGALTLAALLALSFHVWPRYFLASIGFALLVGVRGCDVVGNELARRFAPGWGQRLGTAFCGVAVLGFLFLLPANYRSPKQDYPAARDYVESIRGASEPVVAISLAIYPYENYYAPQWLTAESISDFDRVVDPRGTWVVSSFPTYLRSIHPEIVERLASDFELLREFPGTLGDGAISVYHTRGDDE